LGLVRAEEITPSEEQTTLLRGTVTVKDGIRAVTGTVDETGHGPLTYYNIPFQEGTFSCSWKVDAEQPVLFVFDGGGNGKATHVLKVYINGGPGKSSSDTLTLVTYDGSTKEKKNANMAKHKHHADPEKWHEISVTFEGNKATVVVDRKTFTVTSDQFHEAIEKCGIGHFSGTLETKDVKVDKIK
jgi:hypothetical protein